MFWLRKIVSSIRSGLVEQAVVGATPTFQCLTAEPALALESGQRDENPTEPRRYFVKTEIARAMPMAQCFTTEPALAHKSDQEDQNPTKQRRYFAKTGVYVDNEEEVLASRSVGAEEVMPDKPPTDLKSIFPKLSLR